MSSIRVVLNGFLGFFAFVSLFATSNFLLNYYEFKNEGIATLLKKSMITVSDGKILNLDFELVINSKTYSFNCIESDINESRYFVGQKITVIYKFIDNGYNVNGIIKPKKSHIIIYYLVFILSILMVLKCLHFFIINWVTVVELYKSMPVVKEYFLISMSYHLETRVSEKSN
ncbi:MAG: hypothetical protein ACK5UE_08195 [Chitinophagales bacterium]|jgi:hypothetical protein|nr:hypothetical protein [Sphingobacteriales bacterium]